MAYVSIKDEYERYQMGDSEIIANDGISFDIEKGEFAVIIGPSGAGKSTVLNILGGMDNADEGQVLVDNIDIAKFTKKQLTGYRRNDVGFVFQFYNLVPNLTTKENVELAAQISPHALDAEMVLREVGLGERLNNFPAQLSGGEQQRVAIARALVNNPAIVIADEPTGNLDSKTGKNILDLIFQLRDQLQMTFIIATHDTHVAKLSDRVLKMEDGLLVQETFNDHTKSSEQEGGITPCY